MSFKTLEDLAIEIAKEQKVNIKENEAWAKSAFGWMRGLSPGTKGARGRQMAAGYLQKYGFTPTTSRGLLIVNGSSISVKTSMAWEAGTITFQNIRDTKFSFVLCLGIYPAKAYGWLIPKDELWVNGRLQRRRGLTLQHGGQTGDDAWIAVDPDNVPPWLQPYGGILSDLVTVARASL